MNRGGLPPRSSADALSTEEYAAKKQSLLSQKMSLSEKITDFETKGLSWLEPAREFVQSLNQAANLLSSPNPTAMTTFLKNIGSNHILRNRQFVFAPKIEYKLVAERSEAGSQNLQFPFWCRGAESNCLRQPLPKLCGLSHHPAARRAVWELGADAGLLLGLTR